MFYRYEESPTGVTTITEVYGWAWGDEPGSYVRNWSEADRLVVRHVEPPADVRADVIDMRTAPVLGAVVGR